MPKDAHAKKKNVTRLNEFNALQFLNKSQSVSGVLETRQILWVALFIKVKTFIIMENWALKMFINPLINMCICLTGVYMPNQRGTLKLTQKWLILKKSMCNFYLRMRFRGSKRNFCLISEIPLEKDICVKKLRTIFFFFRICGWIIGPGL